MPRCRRPRSPSRFPLARRTSSDPGRDSRTAEAAPAPADAGPPAAERQTLPAADGSPAETGAPATVAPDSRRVAIGIDFGGTGIKGALVDVDGGQLLTERIRLRTPSPATPAACIKVIAELVAQITAARPVPTSVPVGVGMPAAVLHGVPTTAANIDNTWIGFPAQATMGETLGRAVRLVNDADAAGEAEMRFGAGRGRDGTVVLITLGTGIGTALFVDGRLVPNMELGHIEIRGREAETRASAVSRERRKLSWAAYAKLLDEYLNRLDRLLWPDAFIVGGGISKVADRFLSRLAVRPPVVAAAYRNNAGIAGAAILAFEAFATSPAQRGLAPHD